MKLEKHRNWEKEGNLGKQPNYSYSRMYCKLLIPIYNSKTLFRHHIQFTADRKHKSEYNVEKEEHEEFTIREPDTVRNPRTVMVHVEHASLAG